MLLVEALPGRQKKGFSGLVAGSAKRPAAGLLWTEVEGCEEPHTTNGLILSPAHPTSGALQGCGGVGEGPDDCQARERGHPQLL